LLELPKLLNILPIYSDGLSDEIKRKIASYLGDPSKDFFINGFCVYFLKYKYTKENSIEHALKIVKFQDKLPPKIKIPMNRLPFHIIDHIKSYLPGVIIYSIIDEIRIYTIKIKNNMIILNFYTDKKLTREYHEEFISKMFHYRNLNKFSDWGFDTTVFSDDELLYYYSLHSFLYR